MYVGVFLDDLQRWLHIAERRGEDQLVAGACQLLDRALGVGAFADILEKRGFDLVTEFLEHGEASKVVLVGPAEIADRSEIDESDLEFVGGGSAEQACSSNEHRCGRRDENLFHGYLRFTDGWTLPPAARRPVARASGMLTVGHEHGPERRRRGRAAGSCT